MLSKIEHILGCGSDNVKSPPSAKEAPLSMRNNKNQEGGSVVHDLDELINWAHNKQKK